MNHGTITNPMTKLPSSGVSPKSPKRARVLTSHSSSKGSIGQPLTERETEVLGLLTEGLSNKSIADRMDLSLHTVKFHLGNAAKKIGAPSRTKAAVHFALQGTVRAPATTRSDSEGPGPAHHEDDTCDTEKRHWINGFAVALAQVHRHSGESTVVCEAASAAGLTLTIARGAGVSSFDIDELKRAQVP
jgi:DNA-binding CsgD family transcriptional regulator